jgi:hypothetical protein
MKPASIVALLVCIGSPIGGAGCRSDEHAGEKSDPDDGDETWGETDGEDPPGYARGISLERVTANQAVQVTIGRDGAGVPGSAREGFLVADRPMLIRAFWGALPDDHEDRNLTARLTLTQPDGATQVADHTVYVDAESNDGDLERSFNWYLDAQRVLHGTEYRVELFETDASSAADSTPDPVPAIPAEDSYPVGTQQEALEMKVTIVPVRHQFEGCDQTATLTDEDIERLRSALYQNNPTQSVSIDVRADPLLWEYPVGGYSDFSAMLQVVSDLRIEEAPDLNAYWYVAVDSCDGGPEGIGGQAFGIPGPNKTNAYQRVAAGLWPSGPALFVHEIGHLEGRMHVACSGAELGPDPDYPHEGGLIGTWGYGVEDQLLYPPTVAHDNMTYCSDRFVSDYGWNFTYDVIRILTSWDYEGASPDPGGPLLVGAIDRDGNSWWSLTRGGVKPEQLTFGHHVQFWSGSELLADVPAAVQIRPHSTTRVVSVEAPQGFDATTEMIYVRPGGRLQVSVEDLNRVR